MKEFKNTQDFEDYLAKLISTQQKYVTATLQVITTTVLEDAKGKFGIYQEAAGPFAKWDELADSTKAERERLGYEPNNPLFRSGETMHSLYSLVEGNRGAVGSDSDIMLWNEVGTVVNGGQRIPPRSVLGAAAFESKAKVEKIAQDGMVAWVLNKPPIKKKI